MIKIPNPISVGWCSDPSIVRVGEDYYIASSTFEWMPGVMLFHSKDLIRWERLPGVLHDSFCDLEGIEPSCAIWAPNLTYCDGVFYLAYTIVYSSAHRYKDTHNFLITAREITGPWSEPVSLNRVGFDPSIFHEEDGRKYVVSQTLEYRTTQKRFRGVTVQEYDPVNRCMTGEPVLVFEGTERGFTEGPNILKKDGYYYLTVAEGGTAFGHCVTMARSRSLFGPYTVDPDNPMLSSTGSDCALQRAGHGQFFTDSLGNWYMAHLCGRPLEGKWSILGRECAIQNIDWKEGAFPKIKGETKTAPPRVFYEVPEETSLSKMGDEPEISLSETGSEPEPSRKRKQEVLVRFQDGYPPAFMTLRRDFENRGMSLSERPGYLRIHGGNSLCSNFKQALLARSLPSLNASFRTRVSFQPGSYRNLAGLVFLYNSRNWYYLAIGAEDAPGKQDKQRELRVFSCINGEAQDVAGMPIPEAREEEILLGATVKGGELQFTWMPGNTSPDRIFEETAEQKVGPVLDLRFLSDEHVEGNGFTACMCGICCQDLLGNGCAADFEWFAYQSEET